MEYYYDMMALLIILTLMSVACLLGLASVYGSFAAQELRRRARSGDHGAHMMHEVVRHGRTARITLRATALLLLAIYTVLLVDGTGGFSAVVLLLISYGVLLFIHERPPRVMHTLAAKIAPRYARMIVKMRPYTNRLARGMSRFTNAPHHTDIYDMEDLLALIERQKTAANNRIQKHELDMASHVLTFGSKLVRDHMVPRRVVHFVRSEEPVGPILLSELHDSGFSRFPVKNEDDEIVGTLYLKDLVEKRVSGIVSNVMSPDVFEVQEDQPLERVLAKFLSTKHHLFIVKNQFHEVVGIITIEDVIEQVMGRRIVDEDDVHEDMREFARIDQDEN